MELTNISFYLAFIAGLASFFSPCVFSLVPAYISYLGGRTAAASGGDESNHWIALSHGLAFVFGFSIVFVLLGVATSALGGLLYDIRIWLTRIGGIVVIIFGIHLTGIVRIPFLEYDLRPQTAPERNRGYLGSAMMGVFFSAGWSPCVGPILGAILTLALSGGSVAHGAIMLTAYAMGLAIPFLFASVQIDVIVKLIKRYSKAMHYIEVGTGIFLILVGVLLFSGRFERLASLGSFLTAYDELFLGKIILITVVIFALLGMIPAYIASRKGRKFIEWWLFGIGLFPIALPLSLVLKTQISEPKNS